MEYLDQIISTTLNSFDFAFCIIVNILTYSIVKAITDGLKRNINIWQKRIILVSCIFFTGGLYLVTGSDIRLVLNSAILAPVFWSWIMKPVCNKFGIDYKTIID